MLEEAKKDPKAFEKKARWAEGTPHLVVGQPIFSRLTRRVPRAQIRAQGRLSEEQMMRERACARITSSRRLRCPRTASVLTRPSPLHTSVARSTMKVTFRKVDPFDLWVRAARDARPFSSESPLARARKPSCSGLSPF